jgi:ubiquinone/menaquinone biosynthesis C-methylase UbiE
MSTPSASPSPARPSSEYVLGTGADELDRLALQARLWSDAAHALWRMARIQPGSHVLDVGCGPGFAAFDLAQLVTRRGRVVGIDESANFVAYANAQATTRHLPQLTAIEADVHHIAQAITPAPLHTPDAPVPSFDAVYARWVLCFVRDPAAVISGISQVLKPGGRLAIHDYFNYETMTAAPRRDIYTRVVRATAQSWRDRGGDSDIMGRVPRLLADAGLELTHLAVHQRAARPGETMWHWADLWWRIFTPKLVQMGYLTDADLQAMLAALDEMAKSPTDFIVPPPVYEMLAVKR